MSPEDVLSHPPCILQQQQRQAYFEDGFLNFPGLIDEQDLECLQGMLARLVERSRHINKSDHQFHLEPGHHASQPRLRRVAYVDDLDDGCWEFCLNSIITDIAVDILGPDIRFRDVFVNFKWAQGGAAVKWHQDIAFYPHTNVGTCQFLLALEEVTSEQGPLRVIPGSHTGKIFEHYNENGEWTGAIGKADLDMAGVDDAVSLTGPAGSVSVHHSCTIHGSEENLSDRGRPMLVITYSAADAIPYTAAPYPSSHYGYLVRGKTPRFVHQQELLMPLPPDWSGGYTSIYDHQDA